MLELTLKQKHRQSLNELETASKRFGHGSVEPMCFKLGLNNPRSLSNKTNADFDNAHMAWHEAWEVISATRDLTPVRTELAALGLTTAPLPTLCDDGLGKVTNAPATTACDTAASTWFSSASLAAMPAVVRAVCSESGTR